MCRVDYNDCEWMILTPPHSVKARKDHKCSNCSRVILAAEHYDTGTWVDEYGLHTVKYCQHCLIAGRWLDAVCGGFLWGEQQILDELMEHWDEEPQLQCRSMAHLIAKMRRKWDGATLNDVRSLTKYATAHAKRTMQPA